MRVSLCLAEEWVTVEMSDEEYTEICVRLDGKGYGHKPIVSVRSLSPDLQAAVYNELELYIRKAAVRG